MTFSSIFQAEKYKGIRKANNPEWVSPTSVWAMQIPAGYSYSVDPTYVGRSESGAPYYLHVQSTEDCNFNDSYGSSFNLAVLPDLYNIDFNDAFLDLTTKEAQKALSKVVNMKQMKVYKQTRNEIILLQRDMHQNDIHVMAFYIVVRGYDVLQIIQAVTRGKSADDARREIYSIIDTFTSISVTSKELQGQYSNMKLGSEHSLRFNSENYISIGAGISVPIPDDYKVETNSNLIRGRLFCAAPNDYLDLDNAIDATVGFSGLKDKNKWPRFKEKDCGITLKKIKELGGQAELPLYVAKETSKGVIAFQCYSDGDNLTWTMAKVYIWIDRELYILTIAFNYKEPIANDSRVNWDALMNIREWISRIIIPE